MNNAEECYLRDLWNSMFNPDIVKTLQCEDAEIYSTLMLLETASLNLKQFWKEFRSLQSKHTCINEELGNLKRECSSLKDELKREKLQPCEKCPKLYKQISTQQKEILDTKKRIRSIASILDIGCTNTTSNNQDTQNALTLMTELLIDKDDSSPTKRRVTVKHWNKLDSDIDHVIAPETAAVICDVEVGRSPSNEIIVPDTEEIMVDENCYKIGDTDTILKDIKNDRALSSENAFVTPKKDDYIVVKRSDSSPVLDRSTKRKRLSPRSRSDFNRALCNLTPEIGSSQQSLANSLEKQISATKMDDGPPKPLANVTEVTVNKWSLKPSRAIDDLLISKPEKDKKLKQTTLSLKQVKEKKPGKTDITTLEGFNGGVHMTAPATPVPIDDLCQSDDEVILSSPGAKEVTGSLITRCPSTTTATAGCSKISKRSRSPEKQKIMPSANLDSLDETVFHPLATSTEKLDSSYDRIPGREKTSPKFKYHRGPVKKKSDREKLEGWDCDKCAKYYASIRMPEAELKKVLNRCSRHRNKFPVRSNTPPGFWDPDFPTSDEEDGTNSKTKNKK